ncbi:MAG: CHAD domain-containing protein, partial [Chloroflexota bacterium]|nr:CHAD domain-containing protein [Chloroflexota bacterium]
MRRARRQKEPLADLALRSLEKRLEIVLAGVDAFDDPETIDRLHQLRIDTKRLRYAIETFAVCFTQPDQVLRELALLQEDLGAIHDLDIQIGMLRVRLATQAGTLEVSAGEIMGSDRGPRERSNALRGLLYAEARDPQRLGLVGLLGDTIAERRRLFAAARERWQEQGITE